MIITMDQIKIQDHTNTTTIVDWGFAGSAGTGQPIPVPAAAGSGRVLGYSAACPGPSGQPAAYILFKNKVTIFIIFTFHFVTRLAT